jgi:hypothetical protein
MKKEKEVTLEEVYEALDLLIKSGTVEALRDGRALSPQEAFKDCDIYRLKVTS